VDFGAEGTTASLTDWHELLQITSPDQACGIVYVRGEFPDNPESVLSRSQRRDDRGNKGTFGLQILPPPLDKGLSIDRSNSSPLERGDRIAHGLVNFRWPYSQYHLRAQTSCGEKEYEDVGTCEEISWVKDGTLFQALRLKLTHSLMNAPIKLKLGGKVHFGCPCSNRPVMMDEERKASDSLTLNLAGGAKQASLFSSQYQKQLEMQLFIDGNGQELQEPTERNMSWCYCQDISLEIGQPKTIVATFRLEDYVPPTSEQSGNKPRHSRAAFENAESDLGIAFNSIEMTDRLWTACVPPNYSGTQAREFCALARCVEQIMGVTSVPLSSEFGTALVYNIMTAQYVDLQSTL
jgi:hypothetical protein